MILYFLKILPSVFLGCQYPADYRTYFHTCACGQVERDVQAEPERLYIMYLWIPLIINVVIMPVLFGMNVEGANAKLREEKGFFKIHRRLL